MGCGCGKGKNISIKRPSSIPQAHTKNFKCPKCGSLIVNINRYDKSMKKMINIRRCTNKSCNYVV